MKATINNLTMNPIQVDKGYYILEDGQELPKDPKPLIEKVIELSPLQGLEYPDNDQEKLIYDTIIFYADSQIIRPFAIYFEELPEDFVE